MVTIRINHLDNPQGRGDHNRSIRIYIKNENGDP